MSFIYQDLRDRERTCIKEKVKSRSKYTCTEISYDPVEMTAMYEHMGTGYSIMDTSLLLETTSLSELAVQTRKMIKKVSLMQHSMCITFI